MSAVPCGVPERMERRDVLGLLVVEDGLGRLSCHEQLAPSEQEQVPRSRATPGVPSRALATLASVSLRLPRSLATPHSPGHLPHALASPRMPRVPLHQTGARCRCRDTRGVANIPRRAGCCSD